MSSTAKSEPAELPQGIVWIASYPKSGNTWTRSFLHNLVRIINGDEDEEQDINAMNEYTTWDISAKKYEELLGKPPTEVDRKEIAALRAKVHQDIADSTDGLSLIKTHNALAVDRGYPTITSAVTSGAVYLVRNPLDVAISFAHHMSASVDEAISQMETEGLETNVTEKSIYEVYGSWSQHVASWTSKSNRAIYVMRYEDMKADPEKAFGNLARHLLMLPTKKQLQTAIDRSSFKKLQEQEAKSEEGFKEKPKKAEKFFRKGEVGEWRYGLRRDQIVRITTAHKEQMQRFGYMPEFM